MFLRKDIDINAAAALSVLQNKINNQALLSSRIIWAVLFWDTPHVAQTGLELQLAT